MIDKLRVNFEVLESPSGWSHKACCPFKDHNDSSPSFFCNSKINIFKCYGCNRIGGPVQFIAEYTEKNIVEIAKNILIKFGSLEAIYDELLDEPNDHSDSELLSFNDFVRVFIQKNINNDKAIKFAEDLLWNLDMYIEKHARKGNNPPYKNLSERLIILKKKLESYHE